jgi:hypothetical protein
MARLRASRFVDLACYSSTVTVEGDKLIFSSGRLRTANLSILGLRAGRDGRSFSDVVLNSVIEGYVCGSWSEGCEEFHEELLAREDLVELADT